MQRRSAIIASTTGWTMSVPPAGRHAWRSPNGSWPRSTRSIVPALSRPNQVDALLLRA